MSYGIDYPIWITVLSLISITISIYFWTKGDTKKIQSNDDYYLFEKDLHAEECKTIVNNELHRKNNYEVV
jgi:hypothetical protein